MSSYNITSRSQSLVLLVNSLEQLNVEKMYSIRISR
jgi:hypothetical protein